MAPDAKLMGTKVLSASGRGYESDVIAGVDWCADNGADVISLSLGGGEKLFESVVAAQMIKRRVEAEDVVGAAVFLASADSDLITGQLIMVNGGHLML